MKKKFIVPARYALLLFVLPMGACHKIVDWKEVWHQHKPDCRIEKIIANNIPFEDSPSIAEFSYNAKGDPVLIRFNISATGRPHLRFHYDHKGRLVAYAGPYDTDGSSPYEFYHLYQYDHKNRVKLDTTYGFGQYVNGIPQPNHQYKSYSHYEYDAFDRVKKISRTHVLPGSPTYVEEYFYNNEGNLSHVKFTDPHGSVQQGNIGPYGDKKNLNTTHHIWMFISRDYSRNNPVPAVQYNKAGLPLRYSPGNGSIGFAYQYNISDSEIFYQCKK